MNLALLERHAQEERPASAGDWLFVVLMVALVVLVAVIPFVIVGWLVATPPVAEMGSGVIFRGHFET